MEQKAKLIVEFDDQTIEEVYAIEMALQGILALLPGSVVVSVVED